MYWAKLIVEVFNTDVPEIYYEAVKSKNPTGKLYCAFKNLRTLVLDAGLATAQRNKNAATPGSSQQVVMMGKFFFDSYKIFFQNFLKNNGVIKKKNLLIIF